MYRRKKRQMQKISLYAGQRKDYVQGGGGNTSVKFDGRLMAVKASGYKLLEVTKDKGYVTVDYQKIRKYYNTVDITLSKDWRKESNELNMNSIVLLENMEKKRPSVEVGFHSILKKCVIHTHSVYANVLCCSKEGRQIAKGIFQDLSCVFVPYMHPGFQLTLAIKQAVDMFKAQNGVQPELIFMENHGCITHGKDDKSAIALHEQVNDRIRKHFYLEDFPKPEVVKSEQGYESGTAYLKQAFASNDIDGVYLKNLKLYPDQLVYLSSKIGSTIRISGNSIQYNTDEKEAQRIEEILLGVVYVINAIKNAGLTLKQMDEKGAELINKIYKNN